MHMDYLHPRYINCELFAIDTCQDKEKRNLFGIPRKRQQTFTDDISWGVVHITDTPVSGDPLSKPDDEVLSATRCTSRCSDFRIWCREWGNDELLVPTGARFTCSIVLDKEANISIERFVWQHSIPFDWVDEPEIFGAFEVYSVQQASYDLQKNEDFEKFKNSPFDSQPWDVPKDLRWRLKNSKDIQEHVLFGYVQRTYCRVVVLVCWCFGSEGLMNLRTFSCLWT